MKMQESSQLRRNLILRNQIWQREAAFTRECMLCVFCSKIIRWDEWTQTGLICVSSWLITLLCEQTYIKYCMHVFLCHLYCLLSLSLSFCFSSHLVLGFTFTPFLFYILKGSCGFGRDQSFRHLLLSFCFFASPAVSRKSCYLFTSSHLVHPHLLISYSRSDTRSARWVARKITCPSMEKLIN